MLAQMTQRLLQKGNFEDAIQVILDDVIALHGAEFGNIQLPVGDELVIVAQRGLPAAFLQAFRRVSKDDGCACGRALRLGGPVVVTDVEKDAAYAAFVNDAKQAGYRSVQSTPLWTSEGRLLGMVSTHFANVHEPTPIEMQTLKSYSIIAAEHVFRQLGDGDLATKAEQMSELLYAGMLGDPGAAARQRRAAAPSSP